MVESVTQAVALIVGVGVALSPFVFAAVSMLRGMLGRARLRRLVLPLAGILLGWIFSALVLVMLETAWTMQTWAIVALAGFWAFVVSAGLNAQAKESRREDGRG